MKNALQVGENNLLEEINEGDMIIVPEEISERFCDSSDVGETLTLEKKTIEEKMDVCIEDNMSLNIQP